ncbi:MAG: preprotein translocase subunit SecG [Clostridia bacterium]|nr:preprotein translocase subunit SecG [Clostridia bacterium]
MNALEIIIGIVIILVSLLIIGVVILQRGHRSGISGVISGGADTFLSRNKARDFDSFLAKWTKVIAIVFFVLALVANVISFVK